MNKSPFTNIYDNMVGFMKKSPWVISLLRLLNRNDKKSNQAQLISAAQQINAKISSSKIQGQIHAAEQSGKNASEIQADNTSYNQNTHSKDKKEDKKKDKKFIRLTKKVRSRSRSSK